VSAPGEIDDRPGVVVVGSVNVDIVLRVARLAGRGETVQAHQLERRAGGKGGNQAAAAARLGARTLLVGCVGADADGSAAVTELRDGGVDTRLLATAPGLPTGTAVVLLEDTGENAITVVPGANAALDAATTRASLTAIGARQAVVLASLEVPLECAVATAEVARERGWLFVLNPAPAQQLPDELVRLVDVLTPNEHEIGLLADGGAPEMLRRGAGSVVITRGADGTETWSPDAEPVRRPAHRVEEVVDTTGAGDAFSGALAWCLAAGRPLAEAVELASVAGALAPGAVGARAGLPDAATLLRAYATALA
jgi:ribokinase